MGARVKPDKWAWLRVVAVGGGAHISPIHTKPGCPNLRRVLLGEDAGIARVLLSSLTDHPILWPLRLCKVCEGRPAVTRRAQAVEVPRET